MEDPRNVNTVLRPLLRGLQMIIGLEARMEVIEEWVRGAKEE